MKSNKSLGSWGEAIAAEYLNTRGHVILERNYRTQYGEIDLITMDENTVVFVEVKTRTSQKFGHPEEAISNLKKAHLLASAQAYLQANFDLDRDWRIDVIAIEQLEKKGSPVITHFENIITDSG